MREDDRQGAIGLGRDERDGLRRYARGKALGDETSRRVSRAQSIEIFRIIEKGQSVGARRVERRDTRR